MAFPAVGTTVPTLSPYQVAFNGLTMGPNTALEFSKLEGFDMPAMRTGDAGRARDHGMFIGLDLMGGREITVTAQLGKDDTSFQHAWNALSAATVPGGTVELPLFINLPGLGTLASLARCRRRQMPIDIQFALGNLADVALQWNASDPRLYSTPTLAPSVGLASSTAGFGFDISFPLGFGGGSVVGVIDATNAGNIAMRPVLVVTGPCTYPSIGNASVTGNPTLEFGVTMAAGDQLVIDTDFQTATYYTAGSTIGVSRLQTLQPGFTWWSLQPGLNLVQFASKDTGPAAGTLTCQYASAYIL